MSDYYRKLWASELKTSEKYLAKWNQEIEGARQLWQERDEARARVGDLERLCLLMRDFIDDSIDERDEEWLDRRLSILAESSKMIQAGRVRR